MTLGLFFFFVFYQQQATVNEDGEGEVYQQTSKENSNLALTKIVTKTTNE